MKTFKRGETVIRVHPPKTTPEEQKRVLAEIQRINWEIWDSIQGGESNESQSGGMGKVALG
ncbi:hypothetical protein [Salinithrix halophila]|uniref:Uncharacterized protein n=1 Tax=Salinithrix halophila TaxID=1485204 RepID=A0ABV8JIK6_9BACL